MPGEPPDEPTDAVPDEPTRIGDGDQAATATGSDPRVGPSTAAASEEGYRWHSPSDTDRARHQVPPDVQHGPLQASPGPPGPAGPGTYWQPQGAPPYRWPYMPPAPPRPPRSPEDRRRRARRGLALAATLVLAVGAGIGIGAAIAPTSPTTVASALLRRAIESAEKAGTYHYVELSSVFGATYDIKGEAARHEGQQVIRQQCSPVRSDTTDKTSLFDLRLLRGVVYFRGNVVALVDELGVPAPRAAPLVGKWVKVVKGDDPYDSFEEGITTSSNASQLRTAIYPDSSRDVPGSPRSTAVVGGALRTAKSHEVEGTAVLVMDTASGLPQTLRGAAIVQDTERYTVQWTFSHFGETVQVAAPPNPAPYSSLHAGRPPKTACV
ncbi:MAG: hypothetical protein ACRDV8_10570 [Acidimicrobiales bacterium]